MKLEPVIGLEIHVQLTTKSKMFCSCANIFGDIKPNTAICPICMGYPGTLPVPNKQAIEWVQLAGAALNCELARESKFDRKSYFYPDLPKGYQISQFDQPFCGRGYITITVNGEEKKIGITRIHLEEDAAKNSHVGSGEAAHTLIDYNRAGTPLIEIVTEPDIKTPEEARIFLQDLQQTIRALGISDADMEKGQLRCDANISMREKGSGELHPKTEVKNINSFKFVEKALQYEIERQTKEWNEGTIPKHATRGWNADTGKTILQRTKEEAADYRYVPDPDIPPFTFSEEYIENIKKSLPELPTDRKKRLQEQFGVSSELAQLFTENKSLFYFFENTVSELEQIDNEEVGVSAKEVPKLVALAAKTIVRDIKKMLEENNLEYPSEAFKITPENFAELMVILHDGNINRSAMVDVLQEIQRTGGDPHPIIKNLGLEQVSGEDDLMRYVKDVISENPDIVEKIKAGKEAAIQFLMGQVMAKSQGKANPGKIIQMLRKEILG